jgi:hypothetical protein
MSEDLSKLMNNVYPLVLEHTSGGQKGGVIRYTDNREDKEINSEVLEGEDDVPDLRILDDWNNYLNKTYKELPGRIPPLPEDKKLSTISKFKDINFEKITVIHGKFKAMAQDSLGGTIQENLVLRDSLLFTIDETSFEPFYFNRIKQIRNLIFEILNDFADFSEDLIINPNAGSGWNDGARELATESGSQEISKGENPMWELGKCISLERFGDAIPESEEMISAELAYFLDTIKMINTFNNTCFKQIVSDAIEYYKKNNTFNDFQLNNLNIEDNYNKSISEYSGKPWILSPRPDLNERKKKLLEKCAIKVAAFCILIDNKKTPDFLSLMIGDIGEDETYNINKEFAKAHKLFCNELDLESEDSDTTSGLGGGGPASSTKEEEDDNVKLVKLVKLVMGRFTEEDETEADEGEDEKKKYTMYSWQHQSGRPNEISLSELIVNLKLNDETITNITINQKNPIGWVPFKNFQEAIKNIEEIIKSKKDMTIKKFKLDKPPEENIGHETKYFVGYVDNEENANTINTLVESSLKPDIMKGGQKGGNLSEKLNEFVQNIIKDTSNNSEEDTAINTAKIDLARTEYKINFDNLTGKINGTVKQVDKLCEHNRSTEQKHNENVANNNEMILATKTGGSRKRRRRKRRGVKNKSMKR